MKTVGTRVDDMVLLENAGIKFALGENPKRVYKGKNQLPSTRMGTAAITVSYTHLDVYKRQTENRDSRNQTPF